MGLEQGVTLASLPVLVPLFISHLKTFCRAVEDRLRDRDAGEDSPWPLLTDLASIGAVLLLWTAGSLPVAIMHWQSVILLGLGVGLGMGPLRDSAVTVQARLGAAVAPAGPDDPDPDAMPPAAPSAAAGRK